MKHNRRIFMPGRLFGQNVRNRFIAYQLINNMSDIVYNLDITQLSEKSQFSTGNNLIGLSFNLAGDKLYLCEYAISRVRQYSVDIPWSLDVVTYDNKEIFVDDLYVNSGISYGAPYGVTFDKSGTKLYITMYSRGNNIDQYTLSTPWDISTATFIHKTFALPSRYYPNMVFNNDGTKFYTSDRNAPTMLEFTLSTPWDITTSELSFTNSSLGSLDTDFQSMCLNSNGTKMYIIGTGISDNIFQFTLSTPWDLSTAIYDEIYYHDTNISTYSAMNISADDKHLYFIKDLATLIELSI